MLRRLFLDAQHFGHIIENYSKCFRGITPHVWLDAIFTFGAPPE